MNEVQEINVKAIEEEVRQKVLHEWQELTALFDRYLAVDKEQALAGAACNCHKEEHGDLSYNDDYAFSQAFNVIVSLEEVIQWRTKRAILKNEQNVLNRENHALAMELIQLRDMMRQKMIMCVWYKYGDLGFGIWKRSYGTQYSYGVVVMPWTDNMPGLDNWPEEPRKRTFIKPYQQPQTEAPASNVPDIQIDIDRW